MHDRIEKSYRDSSIDVLRGLAILTMIAANMAASLLQEPHPLWFRLYGTFAAPLFIFISGMMVPLGKEHTLNYFLVRGMRIVCIGALIDILIWNIFPFTTVDVLYLIGISIPLIALLLRYKIILPIIIALVFIGTPILQNIGGYSLYPHEFYLNGQPTSFVKNQTSFLNHWMIDGWFPLFPWIGIALSGALFVTIRNSKFWLNKIAIITAIVLFVSGCLLWKTFPGPLLTRAGYSELFYPPTLGYIITSIGFIMLLFCFLDNNKPFKMYRPLQLLGESSLLIYVLHLVIIRFGLHYIKRAAIGEFISIYFIIALILTGIAYGISVLKKKWPKPPYMIRLLIGS